MRKMHIDPQILEWAAGGLFVCFYAYKRYNTSPHNIISENRTSTTFFRFLIFLILYLLTLLVIYWLFGSFLLTSPELIAKLSPFFGGAAQGVVTEGTDGDRSPIYGPILAALMLTTLLPTLPKLQLFDRWLLGIFWGLGHIPGQAFWQSEKLRRAPMTFSRRRKKEITIKAKYFEIPEE